MVTITVSVLLNVRYYYFCGYMLLRSMVIFLKQKLEIFLQKKTDKKQCFLFLSLSVPFSFPLSPSLQYFLADCWVGGWDWEGHFISPLPHPLSLSPSTPLPLSIALPPKNTHQPSASKKNQNAWLVLLTCCELFFSFLADCWVGGWERGGLRTLFHFWKKCRKSRNNFWKCINKKYDFRFFVFSTLLFLSLTHFAIKTFYTYSYVHFVQLKILIKLFTHKVFKFVFLSSNGVGHVFFKVKPMTKNCQPDDCPRPTLRSNNNNNSNSNNNTTINNIQHTQQSTNYKIK